MSLCTCRLKETILNLARSNCFIQNYDCTRILDVPNDALLLYMLVRAGLAIALILRFIL